MRHHVVVGKPAKKKGEWDEVTEIASNQVFHYNRKGFEVIPDDDVRKLKTKAVAAAGRKAGRKAAKKKTDSTKETTSNKDATTK